MALLHNEAAERESRREAPGCRLTERQIETMIKWGRVWSRLE